MASPRMPVDESFRIQYVEAPGRSESSPENDDSYQANYLSIYRISEFRDTRLITPESPRRPLFPSCSQTLRSDCSEDIYGRRIATMSIIRIRPRPSPGGFAVTSNVRSTLDEGTFACSIRP